jgi:hypothetical protein
MKEQIYSRFLEHCEPALLPGPWSDLTNKHGVVRAPRFPTATLAQLAGEFPEAHLLASGVAKSDEDGGLLPSDGWSHGAEDLILPLRVSDAAPPFDLLTGSGLISACGLALIAVLNDSSTKNAIAENDYLCLAANMLDLMVLRSLGLAAALPSGLDRLDYAQMLELCQAFEWRMPDFGRQTLRLDIPTQLPDQPRDPSEEVRELGDDEAPQAAADPPAAASSESLRQDAAEHEVREQEEERVEEPIIPVLVAVDWSPAQLSLEQPPIWSRIRESLGMYASQLEIAIHIDQWRPAEEQLSRFRFLTDVGAISVACQTLLQHLDHAPANWFIERPAPAPRPMVDYLGAYDRLRIAIEAPSRSSHERDELKEALDSFSEAVERDSVRPLVELGVAERDPIRRSLALAAANIMRLLQQGNELVVRAQAKLAPAGGEMNATALSQANSLLSQVNALVALCKRLR